MTTNPSSDPDPDPPPSGGRFNKLRLSLAVVPLVVLFFTNFLSANEVKDECDENPKRCLNDPQICKVAFEACIRDDHQQSTCEGHIPCCREAVRGKCLLRLHRYADALRVLQVAQRHRNTPLLREAIEKTQGALAQQQSVAKAQPAREQRGPSRQPVPSPQMPEKSLHEQKLPDVQEPIISVSEVPIAPVLQAPVSPPPRIIPPKKPSQPLYKKPWLWTTCGMLTLGTLSAATIAFLLPRPPNEAALYVY